MYHPTAETFVIK